MKQEFEMQQAEMDDIIAINKSQMPVLLIGNVTTGMDLRERINSYWEGLGHKYGFEPMSAEPSAKGNLFFLATPCESAMAKIVRMRKELQENVSKANTAYTFAQEELRVFEESHNF